MRVDGTVSTVSFPNAYVPEAGPQQLTWPSVRFPSGQRFLCGIGGSCSLGRICSRSDHDFSIAGRCWNESGLFDFLAGR